MDADIIIPEMDSGWMKAPSSFPTDLGKQRCRLPSHLISLLNVPIGSYVSINFNYYKLVCSVYLWNEQAAHLFQIDETVKIITSKETNNYASTHDAALTVNDFKKLKIETLKQVDVSLVFKNYTFLNKFKQNPDLQEFVREILSFYAVMCKSVVNCCHSKACQLFGLQLIIINKCKLSEDSVGLVSSKTNVEILDTFSQKRYDVLNCQRSKILLGGLDKQRRVLKDALLLPIDRGGSSWPMKRKGVLLIGPAGTGKTSLVKSVCYECRASLVEIIASSITRSLPGESSSLLNKIFEECIGLSEEGICVLFFDELEGLFSKKESSGHGKRLLMQMLSLMDGAKDYPNLIIMGATNKPDLLDTSLRRSGRFDYEVYTGIPSKSDRKEILQHLTSNFNVDLNLDALADMTHGFVGADLEHVCQKVLLGKTWNKDGDYETDFVVSERDFEEALKLFSPMTQRSAFATFDFEPMQWNDIGGLEETKLQIQQFIEWPLKHAAAFQRLGCRWPKGILLFGPPGCCKTTLVRAAASTCNCTFLSASAAQLYSPLVGDSEKAIVEIFHHARVSAPSIIFLDEIESIVGKRSLKAHSGIHQKVLSTLLNEMDGIGVKTTSGGFERDVIVVAATNRPDMLDDAILRPGRFNRIIYVPPPDQQSRAKILRILTSKMPISDFDAQHISTKTLNFTGADLKHLCNQAGLWALRTEGMDSPVVKNEHFEEILKTMQPSLSEQQLKQYEHLREDFKRF